MYERDGAIKYIICNGEHVTRGHHEYYIGSFGYIFGRIGGFTEPVFTYDGKPVPHKGADGLREEREALEQFILNKLNSHDKN